MLRCYDKFHSKRKITIGIMMSCNDKVSIHQQHIYIHVYANIESSKCTKYRAECDKVEWRNEEVVNIMILGALKPHFE